MSDAIDAILPVNTEPPEAWRFTGAEYARQKDRTVACLRPDGTLLTTVGWLRSITIDSNALRAVMAAAVAPPANNGSIDIDLKALPCDDTHHVGRALGYSSRLGWHDRCSQFLKPVIHDGVDEVVTAPSGQFTPEERASFREEWEKVHDRSRERREFPLMEGSDFRLIVQALNGERGLDQVVIARKALELTALLLRKNKDYGSSVFKSPRLCPHLQPGAGILVRLTDKIERLENLVSSFDPSKGDFGMGEVGEPFNATIADLVGYGILYLCLGEVHAPISGQLNFDPLPRSPDDDPEPPC